MPWYIYYNPYLNHLVVTMSEFGIERVELNATFQYSAFFLIHEVLLLLLN
jgi:hypothetical protein